MLRLTGTNKLQVVLSGAATASRVTVSYMDFTASTTTGGTQLSATNGTTPVDVCDAPAASTTRQIDHVRLVAKAAMTATFSMNNGSALEWVTVALASGDVFDWSHAGGAKVIDAAGNLKTVVGGAVAATTLSVSGASTVAALTASGLLTANAGIALAGNNITGGGGTAAISGFASASLGAINGTTGQFSGTLTSGSHTAGNAAGSPFLAASGSATGSPFFSLQQANVEKAYIQYANATSTMDLAVGAGVVAKLSSTGIAVTGGLSTTSTVGIGQAAPTGTYMEIHGSAAGYSSLRIVTGTAVSSPVDGDMWQDGAHVYMRINGVTKQLDN